MAPMNRSAALSAAAQKLNKPQQIQGRDVTTENGQTGITGAHGGFQQLGQAAQAKLRGFVGGLPGGIRTPPIMDPAAKPPGPGPNVFHPTNPAAGGDLQIMDGAPGTAVPGDGVQTMPFGGRTPSFGNLNQTLGVGGPQDEVQAAQHMGANIPPGVANAMRQQQAGGAGGGPSLGPATNYGPANVDGGMPPPGPLGSMPGPSQKPLLRGFGGSPGVVQTPGGGLPTKPMAAPPPGGPGGSIWNRIAGGGGFTPRPTQLQRNNMAAY